MFLLVATCQNNAGATRGHYTQFFKRGGIIQCCHQDLFQDQNQDQDFLFDNK